MGKGSLVYTVLTRYTLKKCMSILVLVRHGESRWNECNRFQGWVDVPLSENGVREAEHCAKHCKEFDFSAAYTSALVRAQETLLLILAQQGRTGIFQHDHDPRYSKWVKTSNHCGDGDIPIFETQTMNERYYGDLQGMEKIEAEKKYGKSKLLVWRRGYEERPPNGESLKEVFERVHPYFMKHVQPRLKRGETVLLSGHGNTLRSIIMHLEHITEEDIAFVDLPGARPLVYEFTRGKYKRIAGEYQFDRPLR